MNAKPTDAQILTAMRESPSGIMTYVVRNILAMEHGYPGLKTSAVRTRLKRLEREGRVRNIPSNYAVMLKWAIENETPWIPHDGGRCPVGLDTEVKVKFRRAGTDTGKARMFTAYPNMDVDLWQQQGLTTHDYDITFYMVLA